MTSSLVDSNVLIDQLEQDAPHRSWSAKTLLSWSDDGPIVINQIVYAELAMYFLNKEALGLLMETLTLVREDLPWESAQMAGMAHVAYRKAGGGRERVLPDFLIGAHAAVKKHRIITRDGARYRRYFPDVEVIAPDSHP
jgi:predicted nucleic acid-binding protein